MRRNLDAEWLAIRERLRAVAQPDSRFDMDLDRFIPAFEGVETATDQLLSLGAYRAARTIFVTPDNSIQHFRFKALEAGKRLLVPSYGLHRGFLLLDPGRIGAERALFASWGDGIQHFGEPVAVADLPPVVGSIDTIAAGVAALSRDGLRFGMGHRYLDLEWNLLLVAGCLSATTPVWAIVHDCQMLETDEAADTGNVLATMVATPTRLLSMPGVSQPTAVERQVFADLYGDGSVPSELVAAARLAD